MIRLGLRLAVAGGREAITRLALIAIAVTIGVGLLLATVASLNAVENQNARYAWLETGYTAATTAPATGPTAPDPLRWRLRADYFHATLIGRVDVAATGPRSPIPPGLRRLPGPGQFYASPALSALLHDTPPAQLGNHYPGVQVGVLGSSALATPNSMMIVIGRSVAALSHEDGVRTVTAISTTSPSTCSGDACVVGVGTNHNGLVLLLSVVAAAVLFPVLIFIGAATRLSATRREQRFAAMRLVGATPRQISVISTVESTVAALLGMAAGFGLFFASRPALAKIPFTGDPFFTGDVSLTPADVLLVAFGVPISAALAARLAMRRVNASPLAVTRRVTPRPPSAWRVTVLLAGILELGYFAYVQDIGASSHTDTDVEAVAFVAGVLLIMAGLVVAGPWLTMLGARTTARRANRAGTLIAARRLADNPTAGFRAISGLVLALFVGTCAIGIITTLNAYDSGNASTTANPGATLIDQFPLARVSTGFIGTVTTVPAATMHDLISIPGVTGASVVRDRQLPARARTSGTTPFDRFESVVSCSQLAGTPALGHCPPGTDSVVVRPDFGGGIYQHTPMSEITWPVADVPAAQLQHLPIDSIVVGTDGSVAAVEQARTVLELAYHHTFPPQTIGEIRADKSSLLDRYGQLATVVILTSLPIAGCALAVSIAGGLAERKRPFSLLRLTGAPLGVLRRVVVLEAAAPLLITAVVSIGAGLLAAHLFLRAQLRETLHLPGVTYYLTVVIGLVAALGIIAATLPLLNRITGPETARNE